jgi:beta-N-acetylhexosaminidase
LLVGFSGTEAAGNLQLEQLLCATRVGGALVFGRNVVDPAQVARLTRGMREMGRACTGQPLLVGVDAEGGRVMRLSPAAGYAPTRSHRELGETNDVAETEREARRIGRMLREAGIDWNLGPVVDVGFNPDNPVIVANGRSFGRDPAVVTAHARAWVRGMHAEGVLTALKHFPGHGSSFTDSHHGFVDVTDTADPAVELAPYRALLAEGLVDSVMTAHVFNRELDRRHPATLSRATVDRLLRAYLGFAGLVVSDDLRMGAIDDRYGLERAAVLALDAGVDLLLIADDRLPDGHSAAEVALRAIRRALRRGRLDPARIERALRRVRDFKARVELGRLYGAARPHEAPAVPAHP